MPLRPRDINQLPFGASLSFHVLATDDPLDHVFAEGYFNGYVGRKGVRVGDWIFVSAADGPAIGWVESARDYEDKKVVIRKVASNLVRPTLPEKK
jgi:hypothetical protein